MITSRPSSPEYRDGWERVFKPKRGEFWDLVADVYAGHKAVNLRITTMPDDNPAPNPCGDRTSGDADPLLVNDRP